MRRVPKIRPTGGAEVVRLQIVREEGPVQAHAPAKVIDILAAVERRVARRELEVLALEAQKGRLLAELGIVDLEARKDRLLAELGELLAELRAR